MALHLVCEVGTELVRRIVGRALRKGAMHELSIALSIIEGVGEEARKHGDAKVCSVHLKLGPLSGVVKEALLFSWQVACEGTPLAGADLLIEDVPVTVFCTVCQSERSLASIQYFFCPVCESATPEVIRGKELQVVALEIA